MTKYRKKQITLNMKQIFDNWIKDNKEKIHRSDKYSNTITTISNHLKTNGEVNYNLFEITNPSKLRELRGKYFNINEYYQKNKKGNNMYSRSFDLYIEFIEQFSDSEEIEVLEIRENPNLTQTEKESIILSRKGQGKYRKDLIKLWKHCCITKYKDVSILMASHIKPWKKSNNKERLDPYNGLLLLPNFDKVFDLGLISFDLEGKILISNKLKDYSLIGIDKGMKIKILEQHKPYLIYHNEYVFKK